MNCLGWGTEIFMLSCLKVKLLNRCPTSVLICWSCFGTWMIVLKTLAWKEKGETNTAILLKVIKAIFSFFPQVLLSSTGEFQNRFRNLSIKKKITWCLPLIVRLFGYFPAYCSGQLCLNKTVHVRKAAVVFGGWKLIQESVASKFIGESLVLHLFASTIFSRNSLEAIMIHFMRKWHVSTLFPKEQSLN